MKEPLFSSNRCRGLLGGLKLMAAGELRPEEAVLNGYLR
jgi:hypothetical protein